MSYRWFSRLLLCSFLATGGPVMAQVQAPVLSPAERMARRFPQAVRVGDLIDRTVLRPVEQQDVLGRVAAVVRRPDGALLVVVRLGGTFALTRRPVVVPIEAMTLLGEYMEVVDLSPEQLQALPTSEGEGAAKLPPETVIRVGLAKPSH